MCTAATYINQKIFTLEEPSIMNSLMVIKL